MFERLKQHYKTMRNIDLAFAEMAKQEELIDKLRLRLLISTEAMEQASRADPYDNMLRFCAKLNRQVLGA